MEGKVIYFVSLSLCSALLLGAHGADSRLTPRRWRRAVQDVTSVVVQQQTRTHGALPATGPAQDTQDTVTVCSECSGRTTPPTWTSQCYITLRGEVR